MVRESIIKIPVTFVNEELSTFQAGKFLDLYQLTTENESMSNSKRLSRNKFVIYINFR